MGVSVTDFADKVTAHLRQVLNTRWGEVWDLVKLDDVFAVPDLGVVTVVEVTTDTERPGDFSYWTQPIWVVFQVGNQFFQVIGRNVSHSGPEWDYPEFREVKHRSVKVTEWYSAWRDEEAAQ